MTEFATLQHATYTEAEWTAWDGVLLEGQMAFSSDVLYSGTDQMRHKVGNGTDTWTALDYVPEPSGFTGGSLTSAINEAKGSDIASAATTDIGAATGNFVHVTGTTTITALGTVQAGTRRIVRFAGALILTHNATSLILPTGANITTAANDVATFVSEGGGNWRCVGYLMANGKSVFDIVTQTITNGVTDKAPSEDAVYDALELKVNKTNTVLGSYLEVPEQSKPSTPTNALRLYADASNRLSWIGENGYVRTFDGTANTADRTYTLPDNSGTVALTTNAMGRKIYSYDNTTSTYTGSTGDNILRTISLPANTLGANSVLEIFANFTKSGTAGNPAYAVYIGTSNSALTGGFMCQYIQPGSTSLQSGIWVRIVNKNSLASTNTKGISQAASSTLNSQTIPINNRNFDFSQQLYIHIYATGANAGDTQGITDYQVYIDNPQ